MWYLSLAPVQKLANRMRNELDIRNRTYHLKVGEVLQGGRQLSHPPCEFVPRCSWRRECRTHMLNLSNSSIEVGAGASHQPVLYVRYVREHASILRPVVISVCMCVSMYVCMYAIQFAVV